MLSGHGSSLYFLENYLSVVLGPAGCSTSD